MGWRHCEMTREGEAPAEPWRRQLGRSLALPINSKRLRIAKMLKGVAEPSPTLCYQGEMLQRMARILAWEFRDFRHRPFGKNFSFRWLF